MQDADEPDPHRRRSRPTAGQARPQAHTDMARLGQLAGGVAHDFNNLLNIILGCVDQAGALLPHDSPAQPELEQARMAVRQSALIVAQLLRAGAPAKPTVVDANAVLHGARPMLARMLGARVPLEIDPMPDLWPVFADPAEIWQLLFNLATNACEAMPSGGRLVVRTRNRVLTDATPTATRILPPGDYVRIQVADSGHGMSEVTRKRMFEPFFTTKGPNGTGIGLATVTRIVDQAGGGIHVDSAPGAGTTIEVLLPRHRP